MYIFVQHTWYCTSTQCKWCTYLYPFQMIYKKKSLCLYTTSRTYTNKNSISVAAQALFFLFVLPLRHSPSCVMLFDFHFESTFFILTLWIALDFRKRKPSVRRQNPSLYAQNKTSTNKKISGCVNRRPKKKLCPPRFDFFCCAIFSIVTNKNICCKIYAYIDFVVH